MPTESPDQEVLNPWTVVHVVFEYLVDQGLHPTFGDGGDPSVPAAALLQALGIHPVTKPDMRMPDDVREELAALRHVMFDDS